MNEPIDQAQDAVLDDVADLFEDMATKTAAAQAEHAAGEIGDGELAVTVAAVHRLQLDAYALLERADVDLELVLAEEPATLALKSANASLRAALLLKPGPHRQAQLEAAARSLDIVEAAMVDEGAAVA